MSTQTNVETYEICPECGAVSYGNMFCNTCRTVMNERNGWQLPPWEHPAARPCGPEDIQPFIDRLTAVYWEASEEGTAVPG